MTHLYIIIERKWIQAMHKRIQVFLIQSIKISALHYDKKSMNKNSYLSYTLRGKYEIYKKNYEMKEINILQMDFQFPLIECRF